MGRLRACAAVIRDESILMVEQLNEAGRVVWTLPGGGVESGETPEAAVIRELAEETGLRGEVRRELVQNPDRIYLVDVDRSTEPVVGDELELFSVAWKPLSEVKDDKQVRLVLRSL
ncbi:MAG TPA: NUDIX domain-containing protein [Acidimicrobiales bacterium]|nr:NUDIX domain-containing protein [Acidimicrobiales bacterium]